MEGPPFPARLSARSAGAIALFGLALSWVDLGPGWVLTYHEAYFAEPAREMLRSGDWLIPRMAGVPSWQKPPGTHWMIAASLGLFRAEAEWAVRFPSVLCTVLNALFVAALAARWHGDRVGRLAGLIQLTTFFSLFQGRLAEADMPLCASVSGAMLCLAVGTIGRERSGWAPRLGFFLAAGASFLIKGPFGLALIGGAGFLLACVERRKALWRFLFDPIGLLVLAAVCLPWPILAYRADPESLVHWRIHNLDRFTGAYDGRRSPFFYAYIVPGILLPWTPMAIGGLVAGWRDRSRPVALWRLLACWSGVGLALISASAWKHKHYPIPALPPMAIFAAYALDRVMRSAPGAGRSPASVLAAALGLGGVTFAVVGIVRGWPVIAVAATLSAASGVGLWLCARLRRAGRPEASLAALFGTVALVVIGNQSFLLPRYDLYRPLAEMAIRVNARTPEGTPIVLVEVPHPQILFYLRPPFLRFDTVASFAATSPGDSSVVCSSKALPGLRQLGPLDRIDVAPCRTPMASAFLRTQSPRLASRAGDAGAGSHP